MESKYYLSALLVMTTDTNNTKLQVNLQAGVIQNQAGVFHRLTVVTWFSYSEKDAENGNDILYVFGDPTHIEARRRCKGDIPTSYGNYKFFFSKELNNRFCENQLEQRPLLFICTKNIRTKQIEMEVMTASRNADTGEIVWDKLSQKGEIPAIRYAKARQIELLNTFFERTAWAAETNESPYAFKPLEKPVEEKKESPAPKQMEVSMDARIRRATLKERRLVKPTALKIEEPSIVDALEVNELPSRKVMKHINGVLSCMGVRLVFVAETGCFCIQKLGVVKEATKSQKAFAQHCIQSTAPGSPVRYGAAEYASW